MYSYFQTIAFCLFSLPIVIKDVKVMKIPIVYSYAGLLLLLTIDVIVVKESVLMGIGGMASLFVIFILVKKLCKNKLGEGDVHYSLFCGYYSGMLNCQISMIIACLLAIYYIKIQNKSGKIPFAPFMFSGTVFGTYILNHL